MGGRIKDRIWGCKINTENILKSNMETYYLRNFLKYIHICKEFKWSHYIMRERMLKTKHLLSPRKTFNATKV